MTKIPTWIPVVALALFDADGRILMQQRIAGKHHQGCWEFPGGKVEIGEIPRLALVREISEELAIDIDPTLLDPCGFAEETGKRDIVLFLYTSRQHCGEPRGLDGQEWGWFTPSEAYSLAMAPMDRVLLGQIDGSRR